MANEFHFSFYYSSQCKVKFSKFVMKYLVPCETTTIFALYGELVAFKSKVRSRCLIASQKKNHEQKLV